MDWLQARQELIEKKLARRHLAPEPNPSRMALFDLSSSWLEGSHCPLGHRGYSRDGKKGKVQIEYGLLTDPAGRPVAIRVFEGNTGDPTAFTEIAGVVKNTFGLKRMVMVGDRGMITSARIEALRELDDHYAWITALRAPAIKKLMADDGPLQLSLFDQQDLAEITSPEFPGERLIACRNPALAEERARKREALLAATEKLLAPVTARVAAGNSPATPTSARKSARSSASTRWPSTSRSPSPTPAWPSSGNRTQIEDEARLDGIYVIRTPLPAAELGAAAPSPPTRTSNTSKGESRTAVISVSGRHRLGFLPFRVWCWLPDSAARGGAGALRGGSRARRGACSTSAGPARTTMSRAPGWR